MLSRGRVFFNVRCLCYNALGHPVNLWTTGTAGPQCVLSVHCLHFVSAMPSVSRSVSVSLHSMEKRLHLLMNVHQSQILRSVPCDVSFCTFSLCSHTKYTSTQPATQQNKHSLNLQASFKCLHFLTCHMLLSS
jgi:hypothetical protein